MIKAVIFDLDDTLYPETDYVRSGFSAVARFLESEYNLSSAENKLWQLFSKDRQNVYARLFCEEGIAPADGVMQKLVEIYREHKPLLNLSKETENTLKKLRAKGVLLGIITDGTVERQLAKISALGLGKLVDRIIVTDSLGGEAFRKPNPAAFIKMAKDLGVEFEEAVYVGDNPKKDFAVRRSLPIRTVQVLGGLYQNEPYAYGVEPDTTIENISLIPQILEKWN